VDSGQWIVAESSQSGDWRSRGGKTAKSSGMANCSITTLVEFPGFLGVFGSTPIKKVVFFEFLGGIFAGGGCEQWSVAGGQLKRQVFSWANFEKCTFFWIRMFRIGWLLVGFLLILGKLGVEGKDFLLN
jgi:hypothetical protein